MKKPGPSAVSFSLWLASGVVITLLFPFRLNPLFSPLDGGPLDYHPRLHASAVSPDGALTVKVFRQRNPSYSFFVGAELYAKVYDRDGKLLYERLIGADGAWDELNYSYREIDFDGNCIRIRQGWGRSHMIHATELAR